MYSLAQSVKKQKTKTKVKQRIKPVNRKIMMISSKRHTTTATKLRRQEQCACKKIFKVKIAVLGFTE